MHISRTVIIVPIKLFAFVSLVGTCIPFPYRRLYINRASRGQFTSLWERGGPEEPQNSTSDWLPQWVLLPAIVKTLQACMQWISSMWTPQKVLNHLENSGNESDLQLGMGRAVQGALQSVCTADNVLLLVLTILLLVVLLLQRRRSRWRV